jgi:hypothetical protein
MCVATETLAALDRVGAGPLVRLARQLRPEGDITVVLLLPPHHSFEALRRRTWPRSGEERFVVGLVADLRESKRLAETRLPFDTVFVIVSVFVRRGISHPGRHVADGSPTKRPPFPISRSRHRGRSQEEARRLSPRLGGSRRRKVVSTHHAKAAKKDSQWKFLLLSSPPMSTWLD